jgi:hypothetical protein
MAGGVTFDVITDVTTVGLQDQLLLNVTPPAIDVITDVTTIGSQDQSMAGGVTLSNN